MTEHETARVGRVSALRRARAAFASNTKLRVFALTVAAFGIYGTWAFLVNWQHGLGDALRAGGAQGVSSSIATFSISALIEVFFRALRAVPGGMVIAWVVPALITAGQHALFQWFAGTEDILLTILPSLIMGNVFAFAYVRGLMRIDAGAATEAVELA